MDVTVEVTDHIPDVARRKRPSQHHLRAAARTAGEICGASVSRPSDLEGEILCSGTWNAELQYGLQLVWNRTNLDEAPAVQIDVGDQQLLHCL